jgi:hypothetical protein
MKRYILILSILAATFTSCNFLDREIEQNYDEELFMKSGVNNLRAWGMGTYNYLRGQNAVGGTLMAAACDEADFSKPADIQKFNTGAWDPFTNPDDVWSYYFKGIRHANLFLEKTTNYPHMIVGDTINPSSKKIYIDDLDDFKKLRAEVRLLRAYFYFELIKRYGGVPIITKSLTLDDDLKIPRQSYDSCTNFIVNECDSVYPTLAVNYTNYALPSGATRTNVRLGRVDKPVARGLKLRALLYSASLLNNPTNDVAKWTRAVQAGVDLLTDLNCAHLKISASYKDLFTSQTSYDFLVPRADKNSEVMLVRPYEKNSNNFEKANYPVGISGAAGNCVCPSYNLVKAYGATAANGLTTIDKRLAWNVALPGSIMGLVNGAARKVDSYVGGVDAIGVKFGATTTGFYLRKMLCDNFDFSKGDNKSKSWVLMRLSEMYLNLAEAANEVYGPITNIPGLTSGARQARQIVWSITDRAGLVRTNVPTDKDLFRAWIQEQRRLELAFEEQRFFDVRRWKIAETTEKEPIMGLKVINNGGAYTYEEFKVEDRVFDPKMYRYPIPYNEVSKSGGQITQNEGW